MSSKHPEPFVIPAGIVFEQDDGALSLEHAGDIVLHGTLGLGLSRVRSTGGDVKLHINAEVGELAAPAGEVLVDGSLVATSVLAHRVRIRGNLTADGVYGDTVEVDGDVRATKITTVTGGVLIHGNATVSEDIDASAGDIVIEGDVTAGTITASSGRVVVHGTLTADVITASGGVEVSGNTKVGIIHAGGAADLFEDVDVREIHAEHVRIVGAKATMRIVHGRTSIAIGATRVQAEILQAPEVRIDSAASGRVAVVECHNELGANAIKGCMSLADLEAVGMIADIDEYLLKRGLSHIGAPPTTEPHDLDAEISILPLEDEQLDAVDDPDTFDSISDIVDLGDEGSSANLSEVITPANESGEFGDSGDLDPISDDDDPDDAPPEPDGVRAMTSGPNSDPSGANDDGADYGGGSDYGNVFGEASTVEDLFPLLPEEDEDEPPTDIAPGASDPALVSAEPEAVGEPEAAGEPIFDIEAALEDHPSQDPGSEDSGSEDLEPVDSSTVEIDPVEVEEYESDHGATEASEDLAAEAPSQSEGDEPEDEEQDPVFMLMMETVGRITECYQGVDLPPAVERLRHLVEGRAYDDIRSGITDIWNQLLKYHQKRGMRIQPQVTTTFNTINTIVRKL